MTVVVVASLVVVWGLFVVRVASRRRQSLTSDAGRARVAPAMLIVGAVGAVIVLVTRLFG